MQSLTGVSHDLTAFHVDQTMDEGRHEHTWTVTAWFPAEPWRDARSLRGSLETILHGLAPETEAFQRELPDSLWTGEALAAAVLQIMNPPPVRVCVDRPGFHAVAEA